MPDDRIELLYQVRMEGQAELQRTAQLTKDLGEGSAKAGTFVDKLAEAVSGGSTNLIAMGVAGAGVATALYELGKAAVGTAVAIGKLAEQQSNVAIRTGLSVKEVGLFSQAAENAGVHAGSFTTGMRTLSLALSENSDEGQRAKRVLKDLGIESTATFGAVKPTAQLYREIAEKLSAIEDPAKRAREAIALFGRGGLENLPLLNAEFGRTLDELEKLGVGFSEHGAQEAKKFDDAVDRLNTRLSVLKRTVGEVIAEGLLSILPDWATGITPGQRRGINAAEAAKRRQEAGATLGFSAGYEDLAQARAGGILALQGPQLKPPGAPAVADLEANLALSRRQRIAMILGENLSLVEQLHKAEQDLKEAVKATDEAGVARAKHQVDALKAAIEAAKTSTFKFAGSNNPNNPSFLKGPSLFGRGARTFENLPEFVSSEEDRENANAGTRQAELERARAFGQGLLGRQSVDRARIEARVGGVRSSARERARLAEIRATPGDELSALRQALAIEMQAAAAELEIKKTRSDIFDIAKETAVFEREQQSARFEFEEKILEIRKRALEGDRNVAGGAFDALLGGGTGIARFAQDIALSQARTIFQNATTGLFTQARGALGGLIGGQGSADNPTGIGKLLRGSLFGADPVAMATTANTSATVFNTAALNSLSAAITTSGPGGGGFAAAARMAGVFSLPGVTSGGSGNSAVDEDQELASMSAASSRGGFRSNIGKAVGVGGAAVGGALALANGIHTGGVRGALSAGAGILGGAGSIIGLLAPGSGPLAPLLIGVGAGLGLMASFLGSGKARRAAEIEREDRDHRYFSPTSLDIVSGLNGGYVDYDRRGMTRGSSLSPLPRFTNPHYESSPYDRGQWHEVPGGITSPYGGGPPVTIVNNITAMDVKSFRDYLRDNSDAVSMAVMKDVETGYHPINTSIRRQMFQG